MVDCAPLVTYKSALDQQEQHALFAALSKPSKPTDGMKELLSAGTFSER